jgi:hypothetical protein
MQDLSFVLRWFVKRFDILPSNTKFHHTCFSAAPQTRHLLHVVPMATRYDCIRSRHPELFLKILAV